MGKNIAVFGIYRGYQAVEEGVERLREHGFRNTDISVLLPENLGSKDLAHEKSTKAPEGAAAGAGSGAVIGGALGWLVGIGMLSIPGLGPFIAAGPIMGLLAGVGAGGAVGGVVGALIGMGIPEYEAKRYEGRLRRGGILVSVHCDDSQWAKLAKQVLEDTGAEDISSTPESKADYGSSSKPVARSSAAEARAIRVRRNPPVPPQRTDRIAISRDHPLARVGNLRVAEVMTPNAHTVDVSASLSEASAQMRNLGVGFLCVRSGDEIVGILTDRDITVRATAEGYDPSAATVRDAMTEDYVCCFEDQQVIEAASLMEERGVRRLPVLNRDSQLSGILSVDDIAARSGDDTLAGKILSGGMIARDRMAPEHRARRA